VARNDLMSLWCCEVGDVAAPLKTEVEDCCPCGCPEKIVEVDTYCEEEESVRCCKENPWLPLVD